MLLSAELSLSLCHRRAMCNNMKKGGEEGITTRARIMVGLLLSCIISIASGSGSSVLCTDRQGRGRRLFSHYFRRVRQGSIRDILSSRWGFEAP